MEPKYDQVAQISWWTSDLDLKTEDLCLTHRNDIYEQQKNGVQWTEGPPREGVCRHCYPKHPLTFPITVAVHNCWREVGDAHPATHLIGTLAIQGVLFHLLAYEVREASDQNGWEACDDAYTASVEEIQALYDARMSTVRIHGREYLVAAHPYED